MAEIEKIAADRYRIRSHDQILTVDARDLLDLMDYGLRYARTLEQERAQEQEDEDEDEDEEIEGDGSGLHQCPYCYNLVNEEHEEFCALNPHRNRYIVP